MRRSGETYSAKHKDYARRTSGSRGVSSTRTVARSGADTNLPAAFGILQSGGGSGALGRLRYQGGSVDAGERLER